MKRLSRLAPFLAAALAGGAQEAPEARQARDLLAQAGLRGGFVVHLGAGDGALTAALRAGESFQVHGLDRDAAGVDRARRTVRERGLYGPVAVDRLVGTSLPYIDNLVNLVVAEDLLGIAPDEVTRVLAPRGVALVKRDGAWTKTAKAWPAGIDEWTHYFHDAGGNAVAHDTVVGPPRRLQWLGSPRWSRHHDRMASMSALVTAGGRLFLIQDEGSRVSILLPPKWTLLARDAFNGTVLWKRPIEKWQSHLWPLKSGPTQLARRLVASGDRVYVTLGYDAPLSALDAATGETVRAYEGTRATEEAILSDGTLYALVNEGKMELADFAPQHNLGDQRRVATEFHWNGKPRRIAAIRAETGERLWSRESVVAPLTLAADARRLFYHDGEKVVCLDRASGRELWKTAAERRPELPFNSGPRLLVWEDVVLYKGGTKTMKALAAETGKELWSSAAAPGGYQSPEDLLVVGGLVWSAPTTTGRDSGVFTGRDPRTGQVKSEFAPDAKTYWFHHRCYIAKATDRYLITSRTGIEFVDFEKKEWLIHHWVRGGCLYGVLPANGLLYAPPHNCACYPEAKLFGFNALAPARTARALPPEEERLERGPAFAARLEEAEAGDWPTYRGDPARSGFTPSPVPAELRPAWERRLGGRLSSPTVSGGRLFVAKVDEHAVAALDAATGRELWTFVAGGRVDSPPTAWKGRVLFGSADGWVYSLRASDGALAWRFRAAPRDERHMALEQLESVWPVHGSILVQKDLAHFVAGRSAFLDGGLRYFRLDAATGRKLSELALDDLDPDTGENLQSLVKTLQMPVGLADILSGDGRHVYLRSQRFDLEGNRLDLGPNSGDAVQQGSVQTGTGTHLFAPFGYLDDTWFHRSYWVFGRSFAGGHNGYFQAGKFAPSGQILVHDQETVYGYGRKPQYLKWTTTMEHQLFAASKEAEVVKEPAKPGVPALQHPKFLWTKDVPLYARSMALAARTLFVAGPPDLVDEEAAFKALAQRGEDARKRVAEQDAALGGARGGLLRAVSAQDGQTLAELKLDALPVWDGMAAAGGRLFLATTDGRVIAFEGR